MDIMSFFTSLFQIRVFKSRHYSPSCSSSEDISGLPCIERLNSIYFDCCCAETGLEEVEVLRDLKANKKGRRRSAFLHDILLGRLTRRTTALF
jgi:hypothetical protein